MNLLSRIEMAAAMALAVAISAGLLWDDFSTWPAIAFGWSLFAGAAAKAAVARAWRIWLDSAELEKAGRKRE